MSVSVTFNGVSYSIPEDGEVGWSTLTDYLVALSNASTSTTLKTNVRTATTAVTNVQINDCVILCQSNVTDVILPIGVRGQFYAIYDIYGQAKNSPITITTAAGEYFADFTSTYTIATNYGGVLLQYADTGPIWQVIAEIRDLYVQLPRVKNDAANESFLGAAVEPSNTSFLNVSNLTTCSADFANSKTIEFIVTVNEYALHIITDYTRSAFTVLSDAANMFREADSGTGIYISKLANSSIIQFKNRFGTAVPIEIRALTNQLLTVTGWA